MPTEIVIPLENKPGTLAKVAEVLGAAGINLKGVGYATGARGVLRVVPDDSDAALKALAKARVKVRQTNDVIEVTVSDTPGALARLARSLAKNRVNIEAFYVVGAGIGGLQCVLAVDKPDKARALLEA